jgi:hypothetical protein
MLRPMSLKLRRHNFCTHFSFSGDTRLSGCFTDPTTTNQPAARHVDKLESASALAWHPQGSGQPEISRARMFYPIRREAGRFDTLYEMCLTGRVGSLSWAWAVCPRSTRGGISSDVPSGSSKGNFKGDGQCTTWQASDMGVVVSIATEPRL